MDGETWEALRKATGLNGAEVERLLGWKRGHISLIEHGYRPTEARRAQLLKLYVRLIASKEEGHAQAQ